MGDRRPLHGRVVLPAYREFRDAGNALTIFGVLVIVLTIRYASDLAGDD